MSVTSPTSASPGMSLLEWDEAAVQSYLSHIGLGQYEDLIYEHGITGDVLSALDHSTLQDMGVTSVGHRLALLRAVWDVKREQGLEVGEDEWRPQDAEEESSKQQMVDRLMDLIAEQHERLMHLERDHARLLSTLEETGIVLPVATSGDGDALQGLPGVKREGTTRWKDFGGRAADEEQPEAGPSKPTRRASQILPPSLSSSTNSTAPPPPLTADSSTFQDSFTPTTTSASYPFDSPSAQTTSSNKPPAPSRMVSDAGSIVPSSTSAQPSTTQLPPPAQPTERDKSRAKDDANRAAKSFRVTLEDPCWKVLPAALKKYKINDDWRVYALFICFGNTERCLSYDEKPLMLFQKLKESGQKPVFMLRHIRDIKSPIAVAQQKQLAKLGLPPNSSQNVLPRIRPTSDTSISPTKASLQPGASRGDDGQTPSNGGAFPELPSPGLREGSGAGQGGTVGQLMDKEGNRIDVTYAVAIYPYIADRQDEFDVAVGATFVILSKAKGWYIVQKDPDGLGNVVPDQSKSGWVPAGCLLELSSPISKVSPTSDGTLAAYPGLSPLPPSAIISSSYPAVVLMDWEAKSDDELTLKEGERVKVYKKYCHWSYTIKQDTGERGWVPAWFVGKLSNGEGSAAPTPTATSIAQQDSNGQGTSDHDDIVDGYTTSS